MVYTLIDSMHFRRVRLTRARTHVRLYLDADVVGFIPKDHREVMEFLTNMFRRMRFSYTRYVNGRLRDLGFLLSELAREKIYITTVPDETEHGIVYYHLYINRGVPFTHFIYTFIRSSEPVEEHAVVGVSYDGTEYFNAILRFYSTPHTEWSEFKELLERLAADPEIHIYYHPSADSKTVRLVRIALKTSSGSSLAKMVEKIRKRMQKKKK